MKGLNQLNNINFSSFYCILEEGLDEGFVESVEGVVAHVLHLVVGHLDRKIDT